MLGPGGSVTQPKDCINRIHNGRGKPGLVFLAIHLSTWGNCPGKSVPVRGAAVLGIICDRRKQFARIMACERTNECANGPAWWYTGRARKKAAFGVKKKDFFPTFSVREEERGFGSTAGSSVFLAVEVFFRKKRAILRLNWCC